MLARSDEARLVGKDDELCAVTGTEFHHRAAHVRLGGRGADDKLFGDLIVRQTSQPPTPSLHALAPSAPPGWVLARFFSSMLRIQRSAAG